MVNSIFQSLNLTTEGSLGDRDHKIYFSDSHGNKVSPWHFKHIDGLSSVDSDGNKVFPMVVEIPKNQLEKLEIDTKAPDNPIIQDLKNGNVRLYPKPNPFNYGAMPKTWEDPKDFVEEGGVKYFGDNDPLDLVEISPISYKPGEILTVKVIGALGLIDQDEMDWKIIVVNTLNENYKNISNMQDAEKYYPNISHDIIHWYKTYKVPNNKFIKNEEYFTVEDTLNIIDKANKAYHSCRWTHENLV